MLPQNQGQQRESHPQADFTERPASVSGMPSPWQFSLRGLLTLTTVWAVACSLRAWWGVITALLVIGAAIDVVCFVRVLAYFFQTDDERRIAFIRSCSCLSAGLP